MFLILFLHALSYFDLSEKKRRHKTHTDKPHVHINTCKNGINTPVNKLEHFAMETFVYIVHHKSQTP